MTSFLQNGQAALQTKKFDEAVDCFTKALAETPKNALVLALLGQSLCWIGQREKGLKYLHQAGIVLLKKAKKKKDVTQAIQLLEQLQFWEDYQGALNIGKTVTKINPKEVRGFQLLALTYSRLNQKKQALQAAKQALNLAPNSTVISILLATIEVENKQYEKAKNRLQKVLRSTTNSAEENFRIHKELAKALDKLKNYEEVFPHLHASTEISKHIPQIQKQDINLVPEMIKTNSLGFDKELLAKWADIDFSDNCPPPVFVIGFMRSGTTLTQEVLGAHPDIFVSDETDFIPSLRKELNKLSKYAGTTPEQLKNIDITTVEHLRKFYWDMALERYGNKIEKQIFLDKTTMNTIDLGLINCIFPDAKLIFVTRDPRDICLSCFMQIMTPTPSTVQLLSWQGTADFYALIMHWWLAMKKRICMDFIEFRYEDAIADFEGTYGKIFDFLNLNWDDAVVDFHKNAANKFIVSPSYSQVTQPLYSSSVARWRNYENEFPSIAETLNEFIKEYNYPLE